ncbi:MAG: PKD domain-containing protein, partial [Bacteriodetes bacterium]|nr:PKD domain-containing protein [Bacteroidota bacterium]
MLRINTNAYILLYILFAILSCFIVKCRGQQYDYYKLSRSTFVGVGFGSRFITTGVATDNNGNIVVCGWGNNIPTTVGSYQPQLAGEWDGFIYKLSPDLSTLIWSTYIGGTGYDRIEDLTIGNDGAVYFIASGGNDFPLTNPADSIYKTQGNGSGGFSIAVGKLSSDGSQLLFSRLIGVDGGLISYPIDYNLPKFSITSTPQNEIYVSGVASANPNLFYKTGNAYQGTIAGGTDIFFTKLSSTGTILYSTYFGGSGEDYAGRMCYANGKVYLCGITTSSNFPLATGKTFSSPGDCFVMSWNDGTTPTPNTVYLFGSTSSDFCKGICFNQNTGKILVCGTTSGTDLPYTNVLQQGQTTGGFIASLNQELSAINYITMLGTNVIPNNAKAKSTGDLYVACLSYPSSATIASTPFTYQSVAQGGNDFIIYGLNNNGLLRYGTYLGGNSTEFHPHIVLNESQQCNFRLIIAGGSGSTNYPTTTGAYLTVRPGLGSQVVSILSTINKDTVAIAPGITCGEYMFQGTSTGVAPCGAVNYFYNFGDGTAVVTGQQNVTHKYSKNGTFTVTYRVAYQGDTTYYEKTINVQSQPTIKASPNVLYYCTKQNGIQLSASGGVRYEWSPGAVFSDSTKQNPVAKPTKNMWLYVRGYDANGCFATDSVQVYVTSVTATASSDTIVCKGTSVTLNASGGAEVKWSPVTGLNKPTGKSVIATPTETTTYQVIVGDGDCKDTTHVTISVSNKPKVTLNPAPVICTGGNVQLGAALEGSYIDTLASTYLWTPNINLSNPNIKNPVATPTKTTRYKCTVTNKYGCTITDSVEVKVQNNLKIQLSADTSVCAGFGVLLKASGGANYTWYPPDYLDNPNSATPYCTPQKNITYKVITTSGTCIDSATMSISVNPLPTVKAQGETTVCSGQPVQLSV